MTSVDVVGEIEPKDAEAAPTKGLRAKTEADQPVKKTAKDAHTPMMLQCL